MFAVVLLPTIVAAYCPHPTALIRAATRPIVIAGEMVAFDDATGELVRFAEASGACVASAWRRQDTFPNNHEAYIGHFGLGRAHFHREAWTECDLVIAAGSRLDDVTTEEFPLLREDQQLIHIYPDPSVLSRWRADVPILANPGVASTALAEALRTPPPAERLAWRKKIHAAYDAYATPGHVVARGAVDLAGHRHGVRAVDDRLVGLVPWEIGRKVSCAAAGRQLLLLSQQRLVDQPFGQIQRRRRQPRDHQNRVAVLDLVAVVQQIRLPAEQRVVGPVDERQLAVEARVGLVLLQGVSLLIDPAQIMRERDY